MLQSHALNVNIYSQLDVTEKADFLEMLRQSIEEEGIPEAMAEEFMQIMEFYLQVDIMGGTRFQGNINRLV